MAIDDNTVYGLTGAQVKELPEKIEAVRGLAKELTADDYNWPENNPAGVAMWLLPEGVYSCDATTEVYPDNAASAVNRQLFFKSNSGGYSTMVYYDDGANSWKYWKTATATGVRYSYGRVTPEVVNSLTSTSTVAALSANQGKVLNDKIGGDLSNLTTTDKTSLINAINELVGQSGGGGITELTSADYDYPDANPTSVALWRLPSGVYTARANVRTASSATRAGDYGGMFFVSQLSANVGDNVLVLANYGGTGGQDTKLEYDYTYSDGTAWPNQSGISFIDSREVVDNLTSTRTDYVLSANQGKVLKDMIDALPTGGGVTELTSADYNWPTDNPTSVALWLLEPGIYTRSTADGVVVRYGTGANQTLANNENTVLVTGPTASGSKNYLVLASNSPIMRIAHSTSSGSEAEIQLILNASNVAQTTGTSTTNVMSQNAVTSMVYRDPSTKRQVQIGESSTANSNYSIAIGQYTSSTATGSVAIGGGNNGAGAASATAQGSIALGIGAKASVVGEMNIGTTLTTSGYNSSNYRLLTGLYDGQSAHDAVTVGQVNSVIDNLNSALNINIPHIGA